MTTIGGVELGRRVGPFPARLDRDYVARYAAATRDPFGPAQRGEVVPTVALVTQIWDAQEGGRVALVDGAILSGMVGGVHGEHEVRLHRPVVPGEELRVFVAGQGARGSRGKSFVTLKYSMLAADDSLVAEQWWTTVFLGVECAGVGEGPPDHTMADSARDHLLGTYTQSVDGAMTKAYAEVTNDWSAHHFDLDAARTAGVERVFLHGLCTLAIAAQGVARFACNGDTSRLSRVAARFASPTFLDEDVHVHVFGAGDGDFAFEADCAGNAVLAHGRAELFT
ncbi:MAG: MaoC/PaaZ C-terminal domain-containing protein [Acidimicrobiia bacterium]